MRNKILTVDDSKVMLSIIGACVETLGFEQIRAQHGGEALEILETDCDDIILILLDWNMPVMNGYDCLVSIKKNSRYKDIPVVMVTTESEQSNVILAIKAGAKHYVSKPFHQQDLAAKIMEALGKGW